jgi:hypothetical protein
MVIAQLQFGIFQEPVEFSPQRQRVVAGLGQRSTGQCCGACRFDLFPNLIQQRSGFLLTESLACFCAQSMLASLGVDSKQPINPLNNRHRHALKKFPLEAKVFYEMGPNGAGTIGKAQYVKARGEDDQLGVLLDR